MKFLTTTMKTSGSEKVRMQAADRLTEILLVREQKEIAELRAAARTAGKGDDGVPGTLEAQEQVPEPSAPQQTAEEAAATFLKRIAAGRE